MSDIYIDPLTHDISLLNNQIILISSDEDATRQRLDITLNAFRGEWAFDVGYGVPYLKNDYNNIQLLGKGSKNLLDLEMKQAIINTDGVVSLESFSSVVDAERHIKVSFRVVTEDGSSVSVTTNI